MATRSADPNLIRLLLTAGANIEVRDAEGQTPLLSAIEHDNVEKVKAGNPHVRI